jgi:hypothetical protein
MPESTDQQIARLLREGLDHYGLDEVEAAVQAWRRVLALDPTHAEALDYLESAERQGHTASGALPSDASALLDGGDLEGAYDRLAGAAAREAKPVLEIEASLELLRARLVGGYREALGASAVPVLRGEPEAIRGLDLPADAGFMLSLVDGTTPVADLISLSGMDDFNALRTLMRLAARGVLEMRQ